MVTRMKNRRGQSWIEMSACISLCLLLLAPTLTGFESGGKITSTQVCPNDTVALFKNIKFIKCNANVSLYQNSGKDTLIATWSVTNCKIRSDVLLLNVSLDENGTIWIHDVHPWDEATYVVIIVYDTSSVRYEVQISVMVAPNEKCKPTILKLEDHLFANLQNVNDCGKPVGSEYWTTYDGGYITNASVLKLTPGNTTYYACIEGPALRCVRNITLPDYCSKYSTEGAKSPMQGFRTGSSPSEIKNVNTVFVILVWFTFAYIIIFNES